MGQGDGVVEVLVVLGVPPPLPLWWWWLVVTLNL